jgi:hypothetical protein
MDAPALNFRPKGLYIGGEWVASAEGKSFATINPSNMDEIGEVPFATEARRGSRGRGGEERLP